MHLVQPLATGRLAQVPDDVFAHLHRLVGVDLGGDLALLVAGYRG